MEQKEYISYEYASKTVKAKDRARMIDLYESFGWEVTEATPAPLLGVHLSMRRDRHLRHRAEMRKLETRAEQLCSNLQSLRRSQKRTPSAVAYLLGIIATLMLGGGMCLVMLMEDSIPAMACGILLGAAGISFCIMVPWIYGKLAAVRARRVLPLIDDAEETLANILEQGNELLQTETI